MYVRKCHIIYILLSHIARFDFNHHITRLLIDSLVFSHIVYALSVLGASVKHNQLKDCSLFGTRLLG